ncbi:MAG: C39 family peptidase [Chloroflexota bacterium]
MMGENTQRPTGKVVVWLLLSAILMPFLFVLGGPAPTARAQSRDAYIIDGIPSVTQWYNLSCEYAAAATVTLFWGNLVSQNTFIAQIGRDANPHVGFRGNINGEFGGLRDYGIYAEPLVPVLEDYGYNATVFYGTDVARLEANIRAGYPAVVWLTSGKYVERKAYWGEQNGETYKLVPGEHAVVLYGYDDYGVYIMDVANGGYFHTEWESFMYRWNYFDGMTLIIQPQ